MKTPRTFTLSLAPMLLGLLFLALATPSAHADAPVVLRVTVSGITSGACGVSWDKACGLQYALTTVSKGGDELWVAAGTYTPTTGVTRTISFQLRNGIALYGGFAMTETLRSERNITANVTILSGDIGALGNSSDNSYHVVTGSGVTNTAVLDGFTVMGGYGNGGAPNDRGGGMYNDGGSPTLMNVTFISNSASYGGGMYSWINSNATLTNVTFSGDAASSNGGGMYNDSSSPTLTNVTFSTNMAPSGRGGGMYNGNNSSPTLANVTFSGNTADSGGGMYNNNSSSPTLTDVTFSSNGASSAGGGMYNLYSDPELLTVTFSINSAGQYGGGMNNDHSSPTLTDVAFSTNTAVNGGGGMNNHYSSPTLMKVTFSDNSASAGGGMYNNNPSNPTLTDVTFSGNSASWGGGMNNDASSPIVTNVTFSGNSAFQGGGMYNLNNSSPTVRNAILWGNTATFGPQFYNDGSIPGFYDSVVQDGYPGGVNIHTGDPRLGALGNWGGSTQTIPLLPGSSAIDTGNNTTCATIPTDQRGKPRVGTCDIGAFEFQGYALTKAHGDHQSAVVTTPFANSLEVTLTETGSALLLPGAILTFTAPSSGASVAWSGSVVVTATSNASGAASVAPPTANGTAGSFTVSASIPGTAVPALFALTNAQAETTTAITASANPVVVGQPLTLTVTVSAVAPASGTPTGTVDFYETTSVGLDVRATRRALASHPLVNGVATIAVPSLARGALTLLAIYGGDANYHASTSALYTENVVLLGQYLPLLRR